MGIALTDTRLGSASGPVAQRSEQRTHNPSRVGSTPTRPMALGVADLAVPSAISAGWIHRPRFAPVSPGAGSVVSKGTSSCGSAGGGRREDLPDEGRQAHAGSDPNGG